MVVWHTTVVRTIMVHYLIISKTTSQGRDTNGTCVRTTGTLSQKQLEIRNTTEDERDEVVLVYHFGRLWSRRRLTFQCAGTTGSMDTIGTTIPRVPWDVRTCTYVRTCVRTYVCTYTYCTSVRTRVPWYSILGLPRYVRVRTYVRTYTCMAIRTRVRTYTSTYHGMHTINIISKTMVGEYTCTRVPSYTWTRVRTYVRTYVYVYVRTYNVMYMCTYVRTWYSSTMVPMVVAS